MTTQELAPTAPSRTYSELVRGEIKAECARRDINQTGVAALLGLSQQAVSDRWRGRTPWSLDDVERLESVLGLARGALLFVCARRDSNPQPSDLSPLQVFLGTSASADVEPWDLDDEDDYRRGQCVICSGDCEPGRCVVFDDLVARMYDEGDCGDCGLCPVCQNPVCQCTCSDWAEHDNIVAAAPASAHRVDHNRVTECDECGRCIPCGDCHCYDEAWELAA